MTVEQQSMAMGEGASAPSSRAWVQTCGELGPYVREEWPGGRRRVLVALACNRPTHVRGNHMWSTPDGGPSYEWDRRGRPVRPLPTKVR